MDVIGIDAGGSWTKAARFNQSLDVIAETRIPSRAGESVQSYFESMATAAQEVGADPTMPVGLSLPGMFSSDRTKLRMSPNVEGLRELQSPGLDVVAAFQQQFAAAQVVADNDASLAALAEWGHGLGKKELNVRLLHVTWGTGIGTGFVTDGKTHFGWEGGHLSLNLSEVGEVKTLEETIQVAALVRHIEAEIKKGAVASALTETDLANSAEVTQRLIALAKEGDELAVLVLSEAAGALAEGLHQMALIAYPTIVTLGGAIMSSDWLLQMVRVAVDERSTGPRSTALRGDMVYRGELENNAGMLGAATLAQQASGKK